MGTEPVGTEPVGTEPAGHERPFPAPDEARRVWSGLARSVRRDVIASARQGRAHPDPEVSRVAVGWARAVRRSPSSVVARLVKWSLGLGPALALWTLHWTTPHRVPTAAAIVIMALPVLLAVAIFHRRAATWADDVETANLVAALATHPPDGEASYRTTTVPVPYPWLRLLGYGLWLFLSSAVLEPPNLPAFQFAVTMTIYFVVWDYFDGGWLLPRGGSAIVLDPTGATFEHLRLTLKWSDVTAIDAAVVDGKPCLRWHLRDDEHTIHARSALSPRRRRIAARRVRRRGGALVIPFDWLQDPPEALLRAAGQHLDRVHADAPVR